jgi:CheY-like chemotaxis protein
METILVVEDEPTIAQIVSTLLSDAGYEVVQASNGAEALEYLERVRPVLVLSDIMMPDMDGRELCNKLQSDPDRSSIPVVLMSATHTVTDLRGCKPAAFIGKPFSAEVLLTTVKQAKKRG